MIVLNFSYKNQKFLQAKRLHGVITNTGVVSFITPLWIGSISDKEIVRQSGLLDLLEEGDAVMTDKGFVIQDLLTFKKVHLISPPHCQGHAYQLKGQHILVMWHH